MIMKIDHVSSGEHIADYLGFEPDNAIWHVTR
jgi:hypothetical protein